jgi:hypothetical protein
MTAQATGKIRERDEMSVHRFNLYKVWRIDDIGYDEYDSAVVCAGSEEEALATNPSEHSTWTTSIDNLRVEYIGEAAAWMGKGVVLTSFNAG